MNISNNYFTNAEYTDIWYTENGMKTFFKPQENLPNRWIPTNILAHFLKKKRAAFPI